MPRPVHGVSGNSIFIPNQPSKFEFGTVFAYGQTSSGKTLTMRGSKSELGVIPLAVHDLFNIIQQIHESKGGIFVSGLREEIVPSADQVLELMEFGEYRSSRAGKKTGDAEAEFSCNAVHASVMNLVDLAGSERAAKTGTDRVTLKEMSHINKSLIILGTVIKKLSEGAESQGWV